MIAWFWIGFVALVLLLLAVDLGLLNRKSHVIGVREALAWSALWVALALAFNLFVYYAYENHWLGIGLRIGHEMGGRRAALEFLTGYVVEKSLSLDNMFVIALIFSYFHVPLAHQHRVLVWGVVGALALRGVMIVAGAALLERFTWTVYVLGAVLILSAVKLLIARHDNLAPERNPLIRITRRYFPVCDDPGDGSFFVRRDGRTAVTPLFLALVLVESSDVLFAVDSIPAIFAITRDPFLVFTSNVFAILGLRALYFALAGLMARFRYMKMSLVFLLCFIGVKMILSHTHPIPTVVSLSIIAGILAVGIIASLVGGNRDTAMLASPLAGDLAELMQMTYRQARRFVILVIGSTVLLLGIALIVLPGPAILLIPAGLAILATEFLWARRLLARARGSLQTLKTKLGDTIGRWGGAGKQD